MRPGRKIPRPPLWLELGFLALAALLLFLLIGAKSDLLAAVLHPRSLLLFPTFFLGVSLAALRWRTVLAGLGAPAPRWAAFKASTQALFFYFFLPMGAGAEFYRAAAIRRHVPDLSLARLGSSLLLDRFCGLITFSALAVLLLPLARPSLPDIPPWLLAGVLGGGFAGLAALALIAPLRRRILALREPLSDLTPAQIATALGLSFASSVVLAVTAAFAAHLQGVSAPIDIACAFAASAVTAVIPVSLFGVTATEVTGVVLYQGAGASLDQAIAIAASIYLMRLLVAALGGAWILAARLTGRP